MHTASNLICLYSALSLFCSGFIIRRGLQYPEVCMRISGQVTASFQGEPGAFSEIAVKQVLGGATIAIPCATFEETFKALVDDHADFAVVPIENSLGGSIHANYDLLLRYDLRIIGEYELKIEHCLLANAGVALESIKSVMSHPQALAQCDSYLRSHGIHPIPHFDTAGAAKAIRDGGHKDCAAIASRLAAETYGLNVLQSSIEDHEINYTRFLVLVRADVSASNPTVGTGTAQPTKTSVVFVVPNQAGALYKALACFSLRDIDCCKIESRPTPVELLTQLRARQVSEVPRFRYTFHLDFLAHERDENAVHALQHLREMSEYVRVLGSYPVGGVLTIESPTMGDTLAGNSANALTNESRPLRIGIIGFGKFGQFMARSFTQRGHIISCVDQSDKSSEARALGCEFFPFFGMSAFLRQHLDVVIVAVSIISFEEVLRGLPKDLLEGKLIVDVLSVKMHARTIMMAHLPPSCDVLCTHPMFGPESGKHGWQGLPFLYERVRISDTTRCARFLALWEREGCRMVEMRCEQHDEYAAGSQFITHLTGRILWEQNLSPTPIDTRGFQTVLQLVDNTCKDSFDLFFGLYYFNKHAPEQLRNMREALVAVEKQLAAKEAYLTARCDAQNNERADVAMEECRRIMQEILAQLNSASRNR